MILGCVKTSEVNLGADCGGDVTDRASEDLPLGPGL